MPPPTVSYDKIDHRAADDKEKRGEHEVFSIAERRRQAPRAI